MVSCELGGTGDPAVDSNSTKNSTSKVVDYRIPELYVILAFAAATLSTLIALFNIYKHLRNYNRPELQRSLIRILFIVPVYSVFSWLSLAIPEKSLIFESIRDIWEAVVIWEFLKLILAYCGGESACLLVIMKSPGSIEHMWPFNYCFRPLRLDARFMRICKRFTLQFVLIKPIMAITNIAMLEMCMYNNSVYSMSQLIVYNISYSFSLYGLVLFYLATHHHPGLKSRKPLAKFLSIKMIIFATYYQGLFVQLVPGFDKHYLEALNNFIFCWEMIFFSCLHIWAFGWFEYSGGGGVGIGEDGLGGIPNGGPENTLDTPVIASLAHDYEMQSNSHQISSSSKNSLKKLQGNIEDAMNMGDVVQDTLENFNSKYEDHVKLDTSASAAAQASNFVHDEDEEEAQHNPFKLQIEQAQINATRIEPILDVPPVNKSRRNSGGSSQQPPPQQQQPNPFNSNPFQDDLAPI